MCQIVSGDFIGNRRISNIDVALNRRVFRGLFAPHIYIKQEKGRTIVIILPYAKTNQISK